MYYNLHYVYGALLARHTYRHMITLRLPMMVEKTSLTLGLRMFAHIWLLLNLLIAPLIDLLVFPVQFLQSVKLLPDTDNLMYNTAKWIANVTPEGDPLYKLLGPRDKVLAASSVDDLKTIMGRVDKDS